MIGKIKPSIHQVFVESKSEINTIQSSLRSQPTSSNLKSSPSVNSASSTIISILNPATTSDSAEITLERRSDQSLKALEAPLTRKQKKKNRLLKKKLEKRNLNSYKELESHTQRAAQLGSAMQALSMQRCLMGKGAKRKVTVENKSKNDEDDDDDDDKSGKEKVFFKWKRQRNK